jgi:hypothetical protein
MTFERLCSLLASELGNYFFWLYTIYRSTLEFQIAFCWLGLNSFRKYLIKTINILENQQKIKTRMIFFQDV